MLYSIYEFNHSLSKDADLSFCESVTEDRLSCHWVFESNAPGKLELPKTEAIQNIVTEKEKKCTEISSWW